MDLGGNCVLLFKCYFYSPLSLIYSNYSNLGENNFPKFPTKGLSNIVDLKTHNNPALIDFPSAQAFPKVQNLILSYAYHCCQFMPSTFENLIPGTKCKNLVHLFYVRWYCTGKLLKSVEISNSK